ncbi:NAD(P)-binding protein [Suhomyces tanzawaensis NRRL Y-17324]|uniref:NAD(P)-binding protein n=1 Tax=Suhomyces tanzawaensis NRRL Y-17324 TaxID=984487 RepID=A0A1E4SL90_9ASCO|nr:NAD(P)-binding protein [Suhomyces tanzawaensis NRRL Y-17324]ODV80207.1 NAD(P)-binding protein [Suhomyces tanzawaensis NRRL Y-17324]
MSTKARIKTFFGPTRQYAVAGASNNPSKFGFKVLLWYVSHGLSSIPINPREKEILGQPVVGSVRLVLNAVNEHQDVESYKLSKVDGVSISFLTPPNITVATLKEIATVSGYKDIVKGLWLQPGSYDEAVLDLVDQIGLEGVVIHQDECILVRGEEGMYSANL